MKKRTKSKRQILDESKNLLYSLLEKQRKNNNYEQLVANNHTWVKFCLIHGLNKNSYNLFNQQCNINQLIEKRSTVASKIDAISESWHKFLNLFSKDERSKIQGL